MQSCLYLFCLLNRVIKLTRSVRLYKYYLLQARIKCLRIQAKFLSEFFIEIKALDDGRNFYFEVGKLFLFLKHKEKGLTRRHKVSKIHEEGTVVDVAVVAENILTCDIDSLNFHSFEGSMVKDVFGTFALVVYFLTAVGA